MNKNVISENDKINLNKEKEKEDAILHHYLSKNINH